MTHSGTSPAGYSIAQKALHWAVVFLIAAQYLLFDGVGRTFNMLLRDGVAGYDVTMIGHIVIGVAILLASLARLALRLRHGAPALPEGQHPMLARLAHGAHMLLYILLLALPISGLIAWFGALGGMGEVHGVLTSALLAVIALHVAGALAHQFILKDNLIRRIV
ncbi:MAG: cytochrome b [Qingshengfaniella sp.]